MVADILDFETWFLNTDIWGYLGPFALVFAGFLITRQSKELGFGWFLILCLVTLQYLGLLAVTPGYIWHILILLGGGFVGCLLPWFDR